MKAILCVGKQACVLNVGVQLNTVSVDKKTAFWHLLSS